LSPEVLLALALHWRDEATYWRMTKLKGKNVPKKNVNDARQRRVNAGSFNGLMNSIISNFLGLGVNLDLTVRFAMISNPKIKNAAARIVHGNPIFGISFETIIGNITPPRDDPDAITPNAVARFLKNHVPIELIAE
jgi:hypothetical protein